jgi:transposase
MVLAKRRSRKSEGVDFIPTCQECSPQWQALDNAVPADHPARELAEAFQLLDLSEFLQSYRGQGSLPYRPDLLLRAVLYEMQQGKHSPQEWFTDSRENLVVQWLLQGCRPSRARWYAFRDRVAPQLEKWHEQIMHRAVAAGVTPAKRAAVDGSLIAANASRHRLVNEKTLAKRLDELEQVMADPRQEKPPEAPAWMAPTLAGRTEQRQRYRQAGEIMQQRQHYNQQKRSSKRKPRDQVRVSVSEPEAALGRDKLGTYRPLYNTQLFGDLDSPLILGYGVFAQPNDNNTLGPMLERQAHIVGHKVETLLGDSTYGCGADLAVAAANGVTVYAPWQKNDYSDKKHKKKPTHIPKTDFKWLPDEQTYQCPQGHHLQALGWRNDKRSSTDTVRVQSFRCPAEHCRACPMRERCTPSPESGRTISRSEHDDLIEALRQRMQTEEAQALYQLRRETIELAYADAKQHRELVRFSGHGQQRAETEVGLLTLVHNLLHVQRALRAQPTAALATSNPAEIAA